MSRRTWMVLLALTDLICWGLVGCQTESTPTAEPSADTIDKTAIETTMPPDLTTSALGTGVPIPTSPLEPSSAVYAYTHQRADGNRLAEGKGALPEAQPIDIEIDGEPRWLVAAPLDRGSVWAVVLADGRTQAFTILGDQIVDIPITPSSLQEQPPVLRVSDGAVDLLVRPLAELGYSPPAVLGSEGYWSYVDEQGRLLVADSGSEKIAELNVQALPDARLLSDESGRILFLSDPTARYDHGVLGDDLEATAITLVEVGQSGDSEFRIQVDQVVGIHIPEPAVVEGIAPLWVDLDGDGRREIVVTQSDFDQGAQIVVYDETGSKVATGPTIGRGYRWRHQIAAAPLGPEGQMELVDVLTPHIGGVVEFYDLVDDQLQIVAQVPGFTSHVIGSRNLDMAAAGDFDGDGVLELLLPNQARTELGGIQRTADGAEVDWTVPVDGRVNSNLATATLVDGGLAVGIGREDGILRIWLP